MFAALRQAVDGDGIKVITQMMQQVTQSLGAVAWPAHIHIVNAPRKTGSGKMLRRSLHALAWIRVAHTAFFMRTGRYGRGAGNEVMRGEEAAQRSTQQRLEIGGTLEGMPGR